MHKDLEAWLKEVWAQRTKIFASSPTGHSGRGAHLDEENPAIWMIYQMYNGSEGGGHDEKKQSLVFIARH
jgi:hypothetical protein